MLEAMPKAHVILIDPHDEYTNAFGDMAEVIAQDSLKLPYWFMNHEELCEIFCSKNSSTSDAERLILKEAITVARKQFMGENAAYVPNVDTPVPFRLQFAFKLIEESMGRLEKPEGVQPYLRLMSRMDSLKNDTRFSFMFQGISVSDIMVPVLQRILRRPVDGKPMTILNMAGVPSDVSDVVISFVCRTILATGIWADNPRVERIAALLARMLYTNLRMVVRTSNMLPHARLACVVASSVAPLILRRAQHERRAITLPPATGKKRR